MRPDPAHLTPDDRPTELAAILARSLCRLRDKSALAPGPISPPQIVAESRDSAVADAAKTWLTLHTG